MRGDVQLARSVAAVWALAAVISAGACGDDDARPPGAPVASEPDASMPGGSEADAAAPVAEPPADAAGGGDDASADPLPVSSGCRPGQTSVCQGEQACIGIHTCVADGSAYGACDCGAVQIDEVLGFVGAPCESDADCQGVLGCLTAGSNDYFGNGGPAGGYCSLRCTDSEQCQAVDPLSGCAMLGGVGLCIRSCQSKDPAPGERKCLDRPDVVCRSVVADGAEQLLVGRQDGRCVPRCGSNAECPAGRVCHAQAGFCTDLPPPGGPISAACTDDDECSGRLCDGLTRGDVGICTAPCVLGQLSGCGFAESDPARGAACITSFVQVAGFTEGIGDLGICRELCDVAGDCLRAAEGWICRPLSAAAGEFFGRSGACAPPAPPAPP